ncbi:MAG TPA: fibronectin type III domain-containing protein [Candidatus Saccharimonadia bacterium]|nr:fibronectin type III domain-containing protein [Candidatus Saccharimonadia bacterium]
MILWHPVTRVLGVVVLALTTLAAPLTADVATGIAKKEKDRREKEDKKREPSYLPEGRAVAARFVAGQSIDIELGAAAGTVPQVEFIIRQTPQHGTLSAIRPHTSDSSKAIVTYQHSSPHAPLSDSFTFACRVPDGRWSAPATVVLVGQRMEPKIEIIENPSFGRIFVGEEKTSKVLVRNAGSSPLQTTLTWQEPWFGPPDLSVPVGGTQEFLVSFRPVKAGEYRQDMLIQPGVGSSRMILYADCVLPFSVSPSRLQMAFKESTGEREAIISLVNSKSETVKAEIFLPAGLQGPATVELAPASKVDVRLSLPESNVANFSGKMAIRSGVSVATVDIDAKPTPASMKLVSPEPGGIDFGKITSKSVASREVAVENRGGESLVMEAKAITPFVLEGTGGAVTIEPRQQRTFKISLRADRLGPQNGHLEFLSGTGRITVPLRVDVEESKSAMSITSAPAAPVQPAVSEVQPARVSPKPSLAAASDPPARTAAPEPVRPPAAVPTPALPTDDEELSMPRRNLTQMAVMALLATRGLPMAKDAINPYLDQVRDLNVAERDSSSITISWGKPSVTPSGWVVEFASMVYHQETNTFVKIWTRYPNWKLVEAEKERIGIRLFGLRPAEQYEMRVMGVDREGKVSKPSNSVLTNTSDTWRVPAWAWRLMIVGALGLVGYVLFRVRRGDFMVEA